MSLCRQDANSPYFGFTFTQRKPRILIYMVVISMELDSVLKAWFPGVPSIPLNTSCVLRRPTSQKKHFSVCDVFTFWIVCLQADPAVSVFHGDKIYKMMMQSVPSSLHHQLRHPCPGCESPTEISTPTLWIF